MPGSRCRSTFGCTAARFSVDCADRFRALPPTCVTLMHVARPGARVCRRPSQASRPVELSIALTSLPWTAGEPPEDRILVEAVHEVVVAVVACIRPGGRSLVPQGLGNAVHLIIVSAPWERKKLRFEIGKPWSFLRGEHRCVHLPHIGVDPAVPAAATGRLAAPDISDCVATTLVANRPRHRGCNPARTRALGLRYPPGRRSCLEGRSAIPPRAQARTARS